VKHLIHDWQRSPEKRLNAVNKQLFDFAGSYEIIYI